MQGPVVLVCSPHSGHAATPDAIVEALRAEGVAVAEILDVRKLPREPLGERWCAQGIVGVVAAGGDGTVGTVATHIGEQPLAMGILGLGTANDVARSLELPLDLPGAVKVIATGEPVPVDVGEVVAADGRSLRFMHAATLGLNTAFARLATDADRRRRLGPLTYPVSAVEALATAKPFLARLTLDGDGPYELEALQLAVQNMPQVLGGLNVRIRDLGPQDGRLAVLALKSLTDLVRDDVRGVYIETSEPQAVTVDGEVALETPVHVRLAKRIGVLLPCLQRQP